MVKFISLDICCWLGTHIVLESVSTSNLLCAKTRTTHTMLLHLYSCESPPRQLSVYLSYSSLLDIPKHLLRPLVMVAVCSKDIVTLVLGYYYSVGHTSNILEKTHIIPEHYNIQWSRMSIIVNHIPTNTDISPTVINDAMRRWSAPCCISRWLMLLQRHRYQIPMPTVFGTPVSGLCRVVVCDRLVGDRLISWTLLRVD